MIQFDPSLLLILTGTGILGICAGTAGCFTMLQRKSLFADTIAHATLPGMTFLFLCFQTQQSWILLLGGTCSALFASFLINYLTQSTTLKKDTILGIILSSSFGLGTLLLSKIQILENAHQAGINKLLLGNATMMLYQDLYAIISILLLVTISFILFWKQFSIILFDESYGYTLGISVKKITLFLTILMTLVIVIGLQTVGVILISALLIAPAAAARQWTHSFSTMIFLSILISLFATTTGVLLSSCMPHLPTGPTIVTIASCITLISIFFAPQGIITLWIKKQQKIKNINTLSMLSHFMLFNESKTDPYHPHDIKALQALGKQGTMGILKILEEEGLIKSTHKNFFQLTPHGFKIASQLQQIKK